MASTMTTFSAALKERYTDRKVENLTLADRPLMARMAKDEGMSGEVTPVPLIYGAPQGLAGITLARAQSSTSNVKVNKFNVEAGDYFGTVSIGDKVIEASRDNAGAFLENKSAEIDGLYEQFADVLATYLYGNSGNAIGRVSGAPSGLVVTLTEITQAMNFEVDMYLERNVNDGTNGATAPTAETYRVTAVDRENGTITLDAVTNIADTNYLFRKGDFKGNTGVEIIPGLQDFIWVDNAPPVLYGMTRTTDPVRLAGARARAADIAGMGIAERLQWLGALMTGAYKGPGADEIYLNPLDWQNLSTGMQSQGWRLLTETDTSFGFEAISGVIGGKRVKIFADRFCPRGTAFLLNMKTWKLHSMRKLIHPLERDGVTILRAATTNDYEYRLVSYPALSTNAPGWNGRVSVAS